MNANAFIVAGLTTDVDTVSMTTWSKRLAGTAVPAIHLEVLYMENHDTNITPEMQEAFEAIASGQYDNFALFSCYLDGKPTAAIVSVSNDPVSGRVYFSPLFVAVTDDIGGRLTDHDGIAPTDKAGADAARDAVEILDWDAYFDGLLGS